MVKRFFSAFTLLCFTFTGVIGSCPVYAQQGLFLPVPGTMVNLSRAFEPVLIKGLKVHPENPFLFDFIIDTGNGSSVLVNSSSPVIASEAKQSLKKESEKLIKYFLAAMTVPEKDLWVNLSPYEKDRMIASNFGETEMGRDMLAQDYILKQLTASLIYPEKNLGRAFWDEVYTKARRIYGTTQIPVNTFNKVWIVADKADIFEHGNVAYVVGAHLKVMLEEDYLALQKHITVLPGALRNDTHSIGANIVRAIILPQIEKEVNQGENFAPLRQMFYTMILASWYKMALKEALLTQIYGNQSKLKGLEYQNIIAGEAKQSQSIDDKDAIFQRYLQAYKKGVFNYIKEDIGQNSRQPIPRKYFSGGANFAALAEGGRVLKNFKNFAMLPQGDELSDHAVIERVTVKPTEKISATTSHPEFATLSGFSDDELRQAIAGDTFSLVHTPNRGNGLMVYVYEGKNTKLILKEVTAKDVNVAQDFPITDTHFYQNWFVPTQILEGVSFKDDQGYVSEPKTLFVQEKVVSFQEEFDKQLNENPDEARELFKQYLDMIEAMWREGVWNGDSLVWNVGISQKNGSRKVKYFDIERFMRFSKANIPALTGFHLIDMRDRLIEWLSQRNDPENRELIADLSDRVSEVFNRAHFQNIFAADAAMLTGIKRRGLELYFRNFFKGFQVDVEDEDLRNNIRASIGFERVYPSELRAFFEESPDIWRPLDKKNNIWVRGLSLGQEISLPYRRYFQWYPYVKLDSPFYRTTLFEYEQGYFLSIEYFQGGHNFELRKNFYLGTTKVPETRDAIISAFREFVRRSNHADEYIDAKGTEHISRQLTEDMQKAVKQVQEENASKAMTVGPLLVLASSVPDLQTLLDELSSNSYFIFTLASMASSILLYKAFRWATRDVRAVAPYKKALKEYADLRSHHSLPQDLTEIKERIRNAREESINALHDFKSEYEAKELLYAAFDGVIGMEDDLSNGEVRAINREVLVKYFNNRAMTGQRNDKAAVVESPGGIDLSRTKEQINVRKEGRGVQMHFDPAMIARIKREGFDGLEFHIESIVPVADLPLFLGLETV